LAAAIVDRAAARERTGDVAAWYEGIVPALDLETTGIDPLGARIVQAALVFVEPGGTIDAEGWIGIVDPGIEIPAGASAVHGITTAIARARGIRPADALGQIAGLLDAIADRALPLVIYNAPFDWPLLIAEARRHDVAVPRVLIIDPLVCDRAMDRYRRGSRKLEDVARHYDYALDHAHDAEADAVAAVAIARAIATRYADVGERTPTQMQPLQADWYAEWAAASASIGVSESTRDGRCRRAPRNWNSTVVDRAPEPPLLPYLVVRRVLHLVRELFHRIPPSSSAVRIRAGVRVGRSSDTRTGFWAGTGLHHEYRWAA
jgi:DNA polymerase-3 subunit epsilon